MKLRELNGELIHLDPPAEGGGRPMRQVDALAEADAIQFDCPQCGPTHRCLVPFEGRAFGDGWAVDASSLSLETLTLRPSIFYQRGCGWHGFITNGEAA